MITVVKINRARNNFTDYIGRKWAELEGTIFGNPFHLGPDGDRTEVLLKFAEYWYAEEQRWLRMMAYIFLQPNAVLGCWCHPLACHGWIIAGYLNWKYMEQKS